MQYGSNLKQIKDFKIKELEVNSLFALCDKDIIEDQLKKLKEEINVKNKNLFEKGKTNLGTQFL